MKIKINLLILVITFGLLSCDKTEFIPQEGNQNQEQLDSKSLTKNARGYYTIETAKDLKDFETILTVLPDAKCILAYPTKKDLLPSDLPSKRTSIYAVELPICTVIKEDLFYDCYSLIIVDLPNCLIIKHGAFTNCFSLNKINLPNCEIIERDAFVACISLSAVDLPQCKTVESSAFEICDSLISMNLPNCETVEASAFYDTPLMEINLPNCLVIGGAAFANCPLLEIIQLPKCQTLGIGVFYNSGSLIDIILYECTTFGPSVFEGASMLTNLYLLSNDLMHLDPDTFKNTQTSKITLLLSVNGVERWNVSGKVWRGQVWKDIFIKD